MRIGEVLTSLAAALGGGFLVWRGWGFLTRKESAASPPDTSLAPNEPAPTLSAAEKANHVWARPIVRQALKELLGREPTLAELQYGQSIGHLESSYGKGWGRAPKGREHIPHDVQGAMASNNWGAVHATGSQPGFAWSDTKSNGEPYAQRFRSYESPSDGAKDKLRHTFIARPIVAEALSSDWPSVWRASLAMRRTMYYGSWCPKAVARYGKAVGDIAAQRNPDASEGNTACEREAAELHAKKAYDSIKRIAAALGERVAVPLGTYEDAYTWYQGQKGKKTA
jgi:hypothetical protein